MTTKYVSVPVPEHLVPEVYALIVNAGDNPAVVPAEAPAGVAVPGNGTWTQAQIEELASMLRNPAGRNILTTVANVSLTGRSATYEELRAAGEATSGSDFTYDKLRGQLSWISKYSKRIQGRKVWPMEYHDRGPGLPKADRYQYKMPHEVATWWLACDE
jgi:hypothetical protein